MIGLHVFTFATLLANTTTQYEARVIYLLYIKTAGPDVKICNRKFYCDMSELQFTKTSRTNPLCTFILGNFRGNNYYMLCVEFCTLELSFCLNFYTWMKGRPGNLVSRVYNIVSGSVYSNTLEALYCGQNKGLGFSSSHNEFVVRVNDLTIDILLYKFSVNSNWRVGVNIDTADQYFTIPVFDHMLNGYFSCLCKKNKTVTNLAML